MIHVHGLGFPVSEKTEKNPPLFLIIDDQYRVYLNGNLKEKFMNIYVRDFYVKFLYFGYEITESGEEIYNVIFKNKSEQY